MESEGPSVLEAPNFVAMQVLLRRLETGLAAAQAWGAQLHAENKRLRGTAATAPAGVGTKGGLKGSAKAAAKKAAAPAAGAAAGAAGPRPAVEERGALLPLTLGASEEPQGCLGRALPVEGGVEGVRGIPEERQPTDPSQDCEVRSDGEANVPASQPIVGGEAVSPSAARCLAIKRAKEAAVPAVQWREEPRRPSVVSATSMASTLSGRDGEGEVEDDSTEKNTFLPQMSTSFKLVDETRMEELRIWFDRVNSSQEKTEVLEPEVVAFLITQMRATKKMEGDKKAARFLWGSPLESFEVENVRLTIQTINGILHSTQNGHLGMNLPCSGSRLATRRRSSAHGSNQSKGTAAVTFETFAALIEWDWLNKHLTELQVRVTALEIREAFIYESVDRLIHEYSHLKLPHDQPKRLPLWQRSMDPVVGSMILLNAFTMGIAADYDDWSGWFAVEVYFTVFFVSEIVLKIKLNGFGRYICGPELLWNWFDMAVVMLALIDLVMSRLQQASGGSLKNMMVFRVARLARLTKMMRLLRLLRLRIFKELALMVKGIIAGLRTLVWAIVLLLFITYGVGMMLRQTVGQDRVQMNDMYHTVLFDSMTWSMFTVFRCFVSDCTLPDGTPLVGHLYERYGNWFMLPYSVVVIFVIFGIFNLIAATFVENVMEAARQKRQLSSEEESIRVFSRLRKLIFKFGGKKLVPLRMRQSDGGGEGWASEVVSNFILRRTVRPGYENRDNQLAECHFQCGGQITREIFEETLQDTEVQGLFDDLEVHVADRKELFDVIDADGNGEVDVSELILGILKLRSGGADKSDIVAAILGIRAIQKTAYLLVDMIEDIHKECEHLRLGMGVEPMDSAELSTSAKHRQQDLERARRRLMSHPGPT